MLERFSAPGDFFVANVSVSTWKQVFVIMNTFNTTLGNMDSATVRHQAAIETNIWITSRISLVFAILW